jgi:ubiquinone/menaquinone biosynthesis C-methylase UbiE
LDERASLRRSALDISCHEGYFSLVLADYFHSVVGVDKNAASLEKARLICSLFECSQVRLHESRVEDLDERFAADFVLCYGLLYHVENPVEIFRRLALLARKALCIETQVLPFQFAGAIEDGSYQWQRKVQGLFGVCVDYADRAEGGLTNVALVPSLDAVHFILTELGFSKVETYAPEAGDYEQFIRGHRVIVMAER